MIKQSMIWIFAFILCTVSVMAIGQGVQLSDLSNELTIIYPKNPSFKQYSNFDLHFHIINGTGADLAASQTSCYIHVYNQMNQHIIIANLSNDANAIDKYVNINSSISDNLGLYPYLVHCNSSTQQHGFVSNTFEISNENKANNLIAAIIAMGIIAFIVCYMGFSLDNTHIVLKIILFDLAAFILFVLIPAALMRETFFIMFKYSIYLWIFVLLYPAMYFVFYWGIGKIKAILLKKK